MTSFSELLPYPLTTDTTQAMHKTRYLLLSFFAIGFLTQCETPESPDFTLSNKIDAPLIAERSFQFFGGENALIDSSSEDLNNLIVIDGDNFITLSQEENLNFGAIENAIPTIEVAPTAITSEVGEIELSNFSSQNSAGNVGEANFADLTGQSSILQEGDLIPGSSSPSPVNLTLSTDYFVSAQIKEGAVVFYFRNQLGFNLDELSLEIFSDTQSLGTITITNFEHLGFRMEILNLVDESQSTSGIDLRNLNVDIEISWSSQQMQDNPGALIIEDVQGDNLIATQVDAAIPSQEFYTFGNTSFSEDEFLFNDTEHYAEIETGELLINEITNSIDVDIEQFQISFPMLRFPPYTEADSLTIQFSGDTKIERNSTISTTRSISLSDARIYATNNVINYNIFGITENIQQSEGADTRIINATDELNVAVGFIDLAIREAFGIVQNRQVLLNRDVASDGATAELMNDIEAEIITIDGIDEISRRLEGIEFTQASLNLFYQTNLNISTSIIAAFLGIDANGNEFFLTGKPGTQAEVPEGFQTEKLIMNSFPIEKENLIKFDIEGTQSPDEVYSMRFDRKNSNITEFFNRLPVEIRFIGLADINKEGESGRITNPVEFSPTVTIDIPLALRADGATFTDTTSADLGYLPGPDKESRLEEGLINIQYSNGIPLGVNLQLDMLDEAGNTIISLPLTNQMPIEFRAAETGSNGFAQTASEDNAIFSLDRSQLDLLNQTRDVRLNAGLNSYSKQEVRIRNTDSVSVSISGNFVIKNKID